MFTKVSNSGSPYFLRKIFSVFYVIVKWHKILVACKGFVGFWISTLGFSKVRKNMVMLVSAFGIVLCLFYVYFNVIFAWFATFRA